MYNTVLGAKPMCSDGRAFYCADHNFAGRKVYSNHRFPCCSGTLPQVAVDYGINAYFRDPLTIYVNLYVPSGVRWSQGAVRRSLQQSGEYPFEDTVSMRVAAAQPQEFTLRLRIPGWATGARIEVNGQRWSGATEPGGFAAVARRWRDGDRIELELPRRLRLESIDRQHPDMVALLCGPLVCDQHGQRTAAAAAQRAVGDPASGAAPLGNERRFGCRDVPALRRDRPGTVFDLCDTGGVIWRGPRSTRPAHTTIEMANRSPVCVWLRTRWGRRQKSSGMPNRSSLRHAWVS